MPRGRVDGAIGRTPLRCGKQGTRRRAVEVYYPTPVPLFPAYVRVALLGGFAFALPAMLHHFWALMAARASSRRTSVGLPFVATSCSVLHLGAWLASRVWLPLAFDQLTIFGGPAGAEIIGIPRAD